MKSIELKTDLASDGILYRGLDNVHFHLEECTSTLKKALVVFRNHMATTEEYTRLCSRLAKEGIEKNEGK